MVINFSKRVRRLICIAICAVLILGGGVHLLRNNNEVVKTYGLQNNKKINEYSMDIIFDDETKRVMCNQNVSYTNNTKTSLDKLYFHIYPNAFLRKETVPFEKNEMKQAYPNGFNEGYIDIKNILNKSQRLKYEVKGEKNDLLEITLKEKLKPNQKISIDMKYNIKLPNCLGRFGYGENTINVTNWFPIACVYDERGWNLKGYETLGDPFYSETSNFHIKMLIPRKYKLSSTGKVINEKNDNEKTLYEIEALKVRDFAFILGEKFVVDKTDYNGTAISTYSLNKKYAKTSTKIAKDSIAIFGDLFGKYPYDTYSVVASDFYIGGMEYPTLVMIDESLYSDRSKFLLEYVIAHETAHQWWYSVVGNDEISEPWLDEALTEYSTILYFEKKYGKETADRLIKTMEVQSKNYLCENIFKATNQYRNSTEYSLNVYTKGAVIFNEIRKEVGDKVFFDTLKEYYSKYMYENVNGAKFAELWQSKGVDINKIISKHK
ncbi:M1 family metallopeptidase [Asaccharospora irregularis]|uniref:Peptidase family M1 n=1 Tax=Asaccharospora irregularis DSM 2635 TaxID=1121321 RepID=A0A1M5L9M0_9FIRM|nr:M1 family metallopeptidase [Asaccharospora irregularis]SHG61698.1 Peptidase family M1 [Asaccharospora irregularis DSM 2635]